jgi:ectoine hydroxylase-related dioxygenase (phytanoyl-CoA dioxygenase family)
MAKHQIMLSMSNPITKHNSTILRQEQYTILSRFLSLKSEKASMREEQRKDYQRDGYLVVKNLFTKEEVAKMNEDIVNFARLKYGQFEGMEKADGSLTDQQVVATYRSITFPHKLSPITNAFLCHPKLVEVLTNIIGSNIKCMSSKIYISRSHKNTWQQDESKIPTRDRSLVCMRIALDDHYLANGSLFTQPGSHRSGVIYPDRPTITPVHYGAVVGNENANLISTIPLEIQTLESAKSNEKIQMHSDVDSKQKLTGSDVVEKREKCDISNSDQAHLSERTQDATLSIIKEQITDAQDEFDEEEDEGEEENLFSGNGVPLELSAGSVVFFNGYTLQTYACNPKKACTVCRSLSAHYCSAESLLPWDVNGTIPPTQDNRDVFMVAGKDPYLHKGYTHDLTKPYAKKAIIPSVNTVSTSSTNASLPATAVTANPFNTA